MKYKKKKKKAVHRYLRAARDMCVLRRDLSSSRTNLYVNLESPVREICS